ncbi:kinase-like domain-containing protein [Pseudomassariella vexata]|uniref:Kinase-like domain-containing protein n=1 Tax=Pseudomassariella vexata TaxID=1141098 RepID=A0A1Y2DTM7_9PEZI|nr:kinase-like domain-containing protein [Pseudomassariella vexata]ORY62642.1 kinase-like domain-containing protein [Pseudomassariella vexata]
MFSSLKGFTSNINSNYTVAQHTTSTAGPWKIYDATNKKTKKPCSVFVFEKKSLDAHGSSLSRSSAAAFKRTTEEVVERLKKEASSLARLRHPSVLELVEPVEDTRGGGLQFATEPVTASLADLLAQKDDQERSGGVGGRSSRYVTEEADGTRRRRDLEIDELEIQKGLLQVSKALEFLHETAGLVHGNLTPEAILVNSKSDWKISGLGFCSPPENSTKPTSVQPISLSEVLNLDSRLPKFVQLNLNYTSPDFVLDNNLNPSADMFSLGLLCVALYNSPHRSPIEANASVSAYKRLFNSSSTVPNLQNDFLASRPLPRDLSAHVLPRLITRRAAQRMTAKEFQESEYFDNILVSTIRFLDGFPAKTPNEKASFMKGLNKVLPSFPKSVMERKILPALLEELKERDLLSLILQNIFKIIELLPSSKRAFSEKVRPRLKEVFVLLAKPQQAQEKDPARDAGLMVVLENTNAIANNCNGKEFKDDILPILVVAFESPTPALVDVAMRGLPVILPVLDFSTIKNELFPVVAAVFSKTNSLAIKVRGLQAFVILCGGTNDPSGGDDGLDGFGVEKKKTSSSSALDKYTMQEKIVPLIKAIKTKEPAVAMAALSVLRVVGDVADADFVAMDILPVMWHMSLGPLLDLKQFQSFMELIKTLSRRVEEEQTKKLQELSAGASGNGRALENEDFMAFGGVTGTAFETANGAAEDDFESLVKGKPSVHSSDPMDAGWDAAPAGARASSPPVKSSTAPAFSWSTPSPTTAAANSGGGSVGVIKAQSTFRTVTPDLGRFESLTPSATQFSQPLQPANSTSSTITSPQIPTANPWASAAAPMPPPTSSISSMSIGMDQQRPQMTSGPSSFSLAPPPSASSSTPTGFSLPPPPGGPQRNASSSSFGGSSGFGQPSAFGTASTSSLSSIGSMMGSTAGTGMAAMRPMNSGMGMNSMNSMNKMAGMNSMMGSSNTTGMGMGMTMTGQQQQPQKPAANSKSGLDKYESLI